MAPSRRAGAASGPGRTRTGGGARRGEATERRGETLARQRERLRAAVGPVVAAAGYDFEDLVVSRAGNRSVVRVVVDGDQGVSSDAIADLSRDISAALDAAERADGPFSRGGYLLEVSSPGVDRPLTEPRHWRRNRGRLVKTRTGQATRTGRILDADEERVRLDIDGETHEFSYADLGPGRVQIEFGGSPAAESSEDGSEHPNPGEHPGVPGAERGEDRGKEES